MWLALRPREQQAALPEPLFPPTETHPSLSFDGKRVAFESARSSATGEGLSAIGEGQASTDIVLIDRPTASVRRLTAERGANRNPCLAGDGETFVYENSDGPTRQSDIYLGDFSSAQSDRIEIPWRKSGKGNCFAPQISNDGSRLGFLTYRPRHDTRHWVSSVALSRPGDLTAVEVPDNWRSAMAEGRIALSPNGKRAVWEQRTVSIDRKLAIRLISLTEGGAPLTIYRGGGEPTLTDTQCVFVALDSKGIYQLVIHDFTTGQQRFLTHGNDDSLEPSISVDGNFIAFTSYATDLVANDTNRMSDIFVYDLQGEEITCLTATGDGLSSNPAISGAGTTFAFASQATNLGPEKVPAGQVYIWERGWQSCEALPFQATSTASE